MTRTTRRHPVPLAAAVVGALGALLLAASPASAHVRVIGDVIPGQPATLQFRVPSELKDATTVRLAVEVPPELAVTALPPVSGWTSTRAPGPGGKGTQLVWTASPGHEIKPAATMVFPVKVGPVPRLRSVQFDTDQTYSNGVVAAWNQQKTGAEEPEFPVPELVIDPEAPPAPGTQGTAVPTPSVPDQPSAPTVGAAQPTADRASSAGLGTVWPWAAGGTVAALVLASGAFLLRRAQRAGQ